METLGDLLEVLSERLAGHSANQKALICGDFNINALDTSHANFPWLKLQQFMAAWDLKRIPTPPTRGTTCIDHIFTNCSAVGNVSAPPVDSDHYLVSCTIKLPPAKRATFRTIKGEVNWPHIHHKFRSKDPIPADSSGLRHWCASLTKTIEEATEKVRIPSHCPPWVTQSSITQFAATRRALRNFRAHPTTESKALRNKERARLKRCLREDKNHYLNNLAENLKTGSTADLWKICRAHTDDQNLRKDNCSALQLTVFTDHLRCKFRNDAQTDNQLMNPESTSPSYPLFIDRCLEYEVDQTLRKWKNLPLGSRGHLGKGALAAKQLDLCPRLTSLFNKWLQEARYPDFLKEVTITPLPKGRAHSDDPKDFRPIAKAHAIATCFEAVISVKLANEAGSKLHDAQHGFRDRHSTTTNLLAFWTSVSGALDAGMEVHCAFLDIQGAFDNVPHMALLQSLDDLGLCPRSLRLFQDFLSHRTARVSWGGKLGDVFDIGKGVPQGSPLGPLLFAIFLNALLFLLEGMEVELLCYADDIKIWKNISSQADTLTLQNALMAASNWCTGHGLRISAEKSSVMAFTFRKPQRFPATYTLGDQQLPIVNSVRDLGVIFQADAQFHLQAARVIAAVHKSAGLIKRLCRSLNLPDCGLLLFNVLALTKLEYAAAVWWPTQHYWRRSLDATLTRFLRALYCRKLRIPFDRLLPSEMLLRYFGADRPSARRRLLDLRLLSAILQGNVHCSRVLHEVTWRIPPRTTRVKPWLDPGRCRTGLKENSFVHRACRAANELSDTWDF